MSRSRRTYVEAFLRFSARGNVFLDHCGAIVSPRGQNGSDKVVILEQRHARCLVAIIIKLCHCFHNLIVGGNFFLLGNRRSAIETSASPSGTQE